MRHDFKKSSKIMQSSWCPENICNSEKRMGFKYRVNNHLEMTVESRKVNEIFKRASSGREEGKELLC